MTIPHKHFRQEAPLGRPDLWTGRLAATRSSLRVGWHRGPGVRAGLEAPPPPPLLTFAYILLTLAHVHVDELGPLHADGERGWKKGRLRHRNTTYLLAKPSCSPVGRSPPLFHSPPEEGEAALGGYCLGQEGLASARRPVEQKARAPQAQAQQLRVL